MSLDVLLTLWGVLRLSSSTLYSTDKSSLKTICWKEHKLLRPQSCTHERRDATRGLINWGICHLRLAVAGKQIKKAWRNLTAGRLASRPLPPLLLSSTVEGISMAGADNPGSISVPLYLSLIPMKRSLEAIQIVKMHSSVFLSKCVCVFCYSSCF